MMELDITLSTPVCFKVKPHWCVSDRNSVVFLLMTKNQDCQDKSPQLMTMIRNESRLHLFTKPLWSDDVWRSWRVVPFHRVSFQPLPALNLFSGAKGGTWQHFEPSCKDLLQFSHKSIRKVGNWCWVIRPGRQVDTPIHPDGVRWGWGQS